MAKPIKEDKKLRHRASYLLAIFLLMLFPSFALAQSGLDLVIHNVEAQPVEGKVAYVVNVYLSILDSDGYSVDDLEADNFTVTEDSKEIQVNTVEMAWDQVTHISMVLDTSGSMDGKPIRMAREAAVSFLQGLSANDETAIISFDEDAHVLLDFTDSRKAARDQLDGLQVATQGGTCLYDALYQAVEMTSTKPSGLRAIVLLTDGVDIKPGGQPCSARTIDDVIALASSESGNVPVYAIGLGREIDEQGLKRITELSGGRYQHASDPSQLEEIFDRISDQLKSKYLLSYTSTTAPGVHNLKVEANYQEALGDDTRRFVLPDLPTTISILSPTQEQEVFGTVKIVTSLITQSETIARVVFTVNGESVGEDYDLPFEFDWEAGEPAEEPVSISAIAIGEDGSELARSSVDVVVVEAPVEEVTPTEIEALPVSTEVIEATEAPEEEEPEEVGSNTGLIIGIVVVVIVVVAALLYFLVFKKKKGDEEDEEDFQLKRSGATGRTYEEIRVGDLEAGSLTITKSKDRGMEGQTYRITKPVTRVGGDVDSDLLFGPGTGVSRSHMILEVKGGEVTLREGLSPEGSRPTYGTYIDEKIVKEEDEPITLRNGVIIRLGNLTELQFNKKAQGSTKKTYEELPAYKPDRSTTEVEKPGDPQEEKETQVMDEPDEQ